MGARRVLCAFVTSLISLAFFQVTLTGQPDDFVLDESAKLTASDGSSNSWFGAAASLAGDVLVLGASRESSVGPASGAAYVFHRVGTEWNEVTKLTASDGDAGERFGTSVGPWWGWIGASPGRAGQPSCWA